MKKKHLYYLSGGLAAAGLLMFLFKALFLGFPLTPKQKIRVWNLEVRLTFEANKGPVKAKLMVPGTSREFTIIDESFVSQGYGVNISQVNTGRQVTWSIRQASGKQTLFYKVTVLKSSAGNPGKEPPPKAPVSKLEGARLQAARELLTRLKQRSADLPSLLNEMMQVINQVHSGTLAALLPQKSSVKDRVLLAAELLALDGTPARPVRVLRMEREQRTAHTQLGLEVYQKNMWRLVDLKTGKISEDPELMVWRRGTEPVFSLEGARKGRAVIAMSPNMVSSLEAAVSGSYKFRAALIRFSLFGLPVDTQQVYRVMLLVPLGAFVLIILRNLVGIRTSGTFMPVLIALSFRETQLAAGLVLFCLLVAMGLAVRLFMEKLRLLAVPRLAAVLMVVVGFMAFMSIVSHNLDIQAGLSVALFPMVILTMTIERMSVVWEERGAAEAVKQGAGSMLCAVLAYMVMNLDIIGHLVFVFPELLMILLAATLLLGRYAGYRLTEIRRFRSLARESQA